MSPSEEQLLTEFTTLFQNNGQTPGSGPGGKLRPTDFWPWFNKLIHKVYEGGLVKSINSQTPDVNGNLNLDLLDKVGAVLGYGSFDQIKAIPTDQRVRNRMYAVNQGFGQKPIYYINTGRSQALTVLQSDAWIRVSYTSQYENGVKIGHTLSQPDYSVRYIWIPVPGTGFATTPGSQYRVGVFDTASNFYRLQGSLIVNESITSNPPIPQTGTHVQWKLSHGGSAQAVEGNAIPLFLGSPTDNTNTWFQVPETVKSINNLLPDINGNIVLDGADIPTSIRDKLQTLTGGERLSANFIKDWAVPLTFAQVKALKTSNSLEQGRFYTISDFATKHVLATGVIQTGVVEPLTVFANSPGTFSRMASSASVPQDIIEYDFDNQLCEDNSTPRPGFIVGRLDTNRNIYMGLDFRNVKVRMYKIKGLYHHAGTYNSATNGFSAESLVAPQVFQDIQGNPAQYREFYVQLPNVTHGATPTLTMSRNGTALTRPLVTMYGVAIGQNELQTLLSENGVHHGLALVNYSFKFDAWQIRSNKIENDLIANTYLSHRNTDFNLGRSRFAVDANDYQDVYPIGNTRFPVLSNIYIGKRTIAGGLNSIVLPPSNLFSYSDVTIEDGCYNIAIYRNCSSLTIKRSCRDFIINGNIGANSLKSFFDVASYNTVLLGNAATYCHFSGYSENNSILIVQGMMRGLHARMMTLTTFRIQNPYAAGFHFSLQDSYSSVGVTSNCVMNWIGNWTGHNHIGGTIQNKFWEPQAKWQQVSYDVGHNTWNQSFTEELNNVQLSQNLGYAPGYAGNAGDILVQQADGRFLPTAPTSTTGATISNWPVLVASQVGSVSIPATAFTRIPLNTVVTDSHNGWNAANNWYTIPQTGIYRLETKYRLQDSPGQNISHGIGADTQEVDNASFLWGFVPANAGTYRHGILNQRIRQFTQGEEIRLYCYIESAANIIGAEMTIDRIR